MTRTKVEEGSRADGILSRLRNVGRFLFSQAFASGQVRLSSNLKREAESLTWLLSCVYTVQAAEDDSTAGRRGPVSYVIVPIYGVWLVLAAWLWQNKVFRWRRPRLEGEWR